MDAPEINEVADSYLVLVGLHGEALLAIERGTIPRVEKGTASIPTKSCIRLAICCCC